MKIEVLDHGYVEFVEAWGVGNSTSYGSHEGDYERGIIEAARQSTQGSFRGWEPAACDCDHAEREAKMHKESNEVHNLFAPDKLPTVAHRPECASLKSPGDARLLSYLYRNNHSGPFEFAGMVLEIQAPIFVFREWHRHRTQSYNEASARYAPLANLNYVPSIERLMANAGTNKQAGSTGAVLDKTGAEHFQRALVANYQGLELDYQSALEMGVPKELARLVLPVGRYSKMRASANLWNWMRFVTLRCDPAAQWEIRQYAHAVSEIIREKFPRTHELWREEKV